MNEFDSQIMIKANYNSSEVDWDTVDSMFDVEVVCSNPTFWLALMRGNGLPVRHVMTAECQEFPGDTFKMYQVGNSILSVSTTIVQLNELATGEDMIDFVDRVAGALGVTNTRWA